MPSSLWPLKVILLLATLKHSSAYGVVYYVAPTVADCPVNVSCNTLNHYADSTTRLQLTDSVFYFMPGTHVLQQVWVIENASHLTLDGFFVPSATVQEEKKAVIDCEGLPGRTIQVRHSRNVLVKNLQIVHCSDTDKNGRFVPYTAWHFYLVNNITLSGLTFMFSNANCLLFEGCSECVITDSVLVLYSNTQFLGIAIRGYFSGKLTSMNLFNSGIVVGTEENVNESVTIEIDQIDFNNSDINIYSSADVSLRNSEFSNGGQMIINYGNFDPIVKYVVEIENCSFSDSSFAGIDVQVLAGQYLDLTVHSCLFYASSQHYSSPSIRVQNYPNPQGKK